MDRTRRTGRMLPSYVRSSIARSIRERALQNVKHNRSLSPLCGWQLCCALMRSALRRSARGRGVYRRSCVVRRSQSLRTLRLCGTRNRSWTTSTQARLAEDAEKARGMMTLRHRSHCCQATARTGDNGTLSTCVPQRVAAALCRSAPAAALAAGRQPTRCGGARTCSPQRARALPPAATTLLALLLGAEAGAEWLALSGGGGALGLSAC